MKTGRGLGHRESRRRWGAWMLACCASWSVAWAAFPEPYDSEKAEGGPLPAEEAARTAVLPEGFRLEVFAAEPEVRQPISITFDERGRLWVAECYTYAENPRRWDLDLNDRILVLEDRDGDGKADQRTVFWDQGKRLTSLVVGRGGAWALCAPQLLFIPDADGDLVPDGEPIVMLDGFEAETIGHNIVNGLKWGPDGWLYGRHGITATSQVGPPGTPKEDRVSLNCSIWRYHPATHRVEVYCHGGTNPWGLDWNEDGQLFYTNTVIGHLWHAIPGAYYERMFGAHLNPYAYELIGHTADHYHWDRGNEKWSDIRQGISDKTSDLGGGHAHMGCLIYQGGAWPQAYHGKLFTCNLHGRRINMEILEREGNGYVGRHGQDFLHMQDPWFRGLDLITGPDGQVWMNDWSDTGECHDHDGVHRNSGRIYRIVYDGPEAGAPRPMGWPQWMTQPAELFESLLNAEEEAKRALGVRRYVEHLAETGRAQGENDQAVLEKILGLTRAEAAGLIRLELAAALQKAPSWWNRWEIATHLASFEGDAEDRQQSLMIWYGLAEATRDHPNEAVELALASRLPTLTRLLSRRLAEDLESAPEPVDALLSRASAPVLPLVLHGLNEALRGWPKAPKPASWGAIVQGGGGESEETEALIRELSVVFGDGRAREELLAMAKDEQADPLVRRSALVNLLRDPTPDLLPLLKNWIQDRLLGREAIQGLAAYEDPEVPGKILAQWKRDSTHREVCVDTLVSRVGYAQALLDKIASGEIPRQALNPYQARQVQNLGDVALKARLAEVWGDLRETPETLAAEISDWKAKLTPEGLASADPAKGKTHFAALCGACHKLYGEGGAIGPDLTGSDRHNLDYLLGNIINPNEVVPADYRLTVFTLQDGRVVSGVVPEEGERSVTVQTPQERIVLPAEAIAKRETLAVSLMPEGLLKTLDEAAVRDLLAYLMTRAPQSAP